LEAVFLGLKSGMLYGQQASRPVCELRVKDRTWKRKTDAILVTGACECVGLLGPLLGGGHGYLQGFYGLISDNLISARVVLATGDVITVSANEHSGMSEVLHLRSEISCLTPRKNISFITLY
jgi:hypothetical protein